MQCCNHVWVRNATGTQSINPVTLCERQLLTPSQCHERPNNRPTHPTSSRVSDSANRNLSESALTPSSSATSLMMFFIASRRGSDWFFEMLFSFSSRTDAATTASAETSCGPPAPSPASSNAGEARYAISMGPDVRDAMTAFTATAACKANPTRSALSPNYNASQPATTVSTSRAAYTWHDSSTNHPKPIAQNTSNRGPQLAKRACDTRIEDHNLRSCEC